MDLQDEGTSAGLDGPPAPGMSRAARTADEAEAASKAAEDMTPVTYNYSFFHFIFALASMYLAMLMTGGACSDHTTTHTSWSSPVTLTGVSLLVMHPCRASCCKVPSLSQCRQGKLSRVGYMLSAQTQGMFPVTGWGTGAEEKDLIDVGWFSVWVKFITQWVTAGTYCWMLAAPTLYPDREFI